MKRQFAVLVLVAVVPFILLAAWPGGDLRAQTVAATPAAITIDQGSALPSPAREIVAMCKGGVDKDVVLVYIQNSQSPYRLSPEGIARLRSSGVPSELIKAMIQRDGVLQEEATQQYERLQQRADALAMQKAALEMRFANLGINRPPQIVGDASAYPAGNDSGDLGYAWPFFGGYGGYGREWGRDDRDGYRAAREILAGVPNNAIGKAGKETKETHPERKPGNSGEGHNVGHSEGDEHPQSHEGGIGHGHLSRTFLNECCGTMLRETRRGRS